MSDAAISVDDFGRFEEALNLGFDKRIVSAAEDDDVGGLIDVFEEFGEFFGDVAFVFDSVG